ncbi:MAG: dTDP-4-dehydrorhamnose reductase [Flavisolibacter sp.]
MKGEVDHKIILVTGCNGQLGSELQEIAGLYPDFDFIFLGKDNGPINDKTALKIVFEKHQPDYLINCAAYTAVDKAEQEKDLALEINGTAVGNLAVLCHQFNTRLIHLSTDYVFDGSSRLPLNETEKVRPINQYGASKLLGEQLAFRHHAATIVIRTSWVYSFYGNNFVKTMMRLMKERDQISVVHDQSGCPTYAADLATAIVQIITSKLWIPGIYNYSNVGIISWFEFAQDIKRLTSANCIIKPITTDQYPTPARRPAYSVLDCKKIKETYQAVLLPWQTSLEKCIVKFKV